MKRLALVTISLFLFYGLCQAGQLEDFFKKTQRIHTLSGEFEQKNHYRDLGETYTFEGRFVLKRPDKLLWRYLKGSEDSIYVIGTRATLIQPEEKQAIIKDTARVGITRAPILFVFDREMIQRDFVVLSASGEKVVLSPKGDSMGLKRVTLLLEKTGVFPLKGLVFEDLYGNVIEVNFLSLRINPEVKEEVFQFTIPQGYTVLRD